MSNEIMKHESNVPAIQAPRGQDQVLASDVTIPKVLQMQALSDWVTEGKAMPGDFVRSSTVEVLGGKNKPLEFIPLTFQNMWMISADEMGKGEYEFKGYEQRNALNEHEEWEFFKDGVKMKRTKVMNLYALLPADIERQLEALKKFQETGEMPDLDAAILPVVIPFRNTSFKAAKEVATLFVKAESLARDMGVAVPVFGRTMKLSNVLEKNDKGSFFVLKVEAAGATKKEYLAQAMKWRDTIQSMGGAVKVDESDVAKAASEEVPF